MTAQRKARAVAAVVTLLLALLLAVALVYTHLSYAADETVNAEVGEIVLDEFFDDFDFGGDFATAADVDGRAQAAPQSEAVDADAADAPALTDTPAPDEPLVTATDPSPVKAQQQPSAAELAKQQEEARRKKEQQQIASEVGGAFANSASPSTSNAPASGTATRGAVTGSSVGRIGKGWGMPAFGGVESPSTGTVIVRAEIDAQGRVTAVKDVTEVDINGRSYKSAAPAATNAQVVRACCAEVRAKLFSRTGPDDGLGTTAFIVFHFK